MPLTMASYGKPVTVVNIRAGFGLQKRLSDMGLLPGTKIRIVNSQRAGPVLIDLKGTRLALGRGAAQKIMVTETQDG
ncbi:MAG: ferrous iron transport protein A [Dehalococcoidia bacterium]|nr:ferrous iron transport protein A [Dehalococcoidia bacterium]